MVHIIQHGELQRTIWRFMTIVRLVMTTARQWIGGRFHTLTAMATLRIAEGKSSAWTT